MPEGLTDAIEWIKTNPKVFVPACLFVLLIGFVIGRAYVHAQDCHVKGVSAYEGVEALTEIHEHSMIRKKAEREHLAALCRAGKLPDSPVTCAKATAPEVPE